MADRRHLWKRVRRVWVVTGITVTAVFVIWSLIAYRASAEAREALNSDSVVAVIHGEGMWRYTPKRVKDARETALVFFPGALVDPRAYAPLARAVAVQGFRSFPWHSSFF
jgi:hypothetical protein